MDSFANIDDEAYMYLAENAPDIQYLLATQELLDDTFTPPVFDPSPFDEDAALRDLFKNDLEDIDSILSRPVSNTTQTTTLTPASSIRSSNNITPTPNYTEGHPHEYAEALRVFDPSLKVREQDLPLGEEPSFELLSRGRAVHQDGAKHYGFGSQALNEPPKSPYESRQSANFSEEDTSARIAKKRKAPTTLTDFFKAQKKPPQSCATDTRKQTAPSMATSAPQATYHIGGPPPAPAPTSQRAIRGKGSYNEFTKDRPPPNVCLPLNVDISIAELMTFFPNSPQIPLVATRLSQNGFPSQTVPKMQLDPVGGLTKENAHRVEQKVKKQYVHAGQCEWRHLTNDDRNMWSQIAESQGPHYDLTANKFRLRHEYNEGWEESQPWGHWKLVDIYGPVDDAKWPQGNDRLVLTQCLEFAKANPHLDLDTSHWDWISQYINAQAPPFPPGRYATRDHEAADRYASIYPTRAALRKARGWSGKGNK